MGGGWMRAGAGMLLVIVAVVVWREMFPSEETRIRRQLSAMAREANGLTKDLGGIAAATRLGSFFTDGVVIDPGGGLAPLRGRETILAVANALRSTTGSLRVSVQDVDVTVAPGGQTAAVTLTATLRRNVGTSNETLDAHEFALTMVKGDPAWQISHVTVIDTLR